ncbi:MAG: dihydrodipicolinate synthase family protein [Anaerolineae bacterium]
MGNGWFEGVVVPLVTPLTEHEQVDEEAMQRLVERQLAAGVDALFVLGSAGEGPMLTRKVQRQVVRVTVATVGGRVPVLAGVSDNSVALVLDRLEEMADLGATAGVSTLPFYGWYDSAVAATEFFTMLADRSPIPLVPYNLPRVTGFSLTLETIQSFYGHPNIPGIKDTNTDQPAMEAVASDPKRPREFKYLPGNTSLAFHLLERGADGFVPASANVRPDIAVRLYRSFREGRKDEAKGLLACLLTLNEVARHPTNPAGLKVALDILGLCSRRTPRSWPQAGPQDEVRVAQILARVDSMLECAGISSQQ